jgi:hypothetical protein
MTGEKLTESYIKSLCPVSITFYRGLQYLQEGRILSCCSVEDGNTFEAEIQGTSLYTTRVTVKNGKLISHSCNCIAHLQYSGPCKHVVALLLELSSSSSQIPTASTVPDEKLTNHCPECGEPLFGGEEICPECGFVLNKEKQKPVGKMECPECGATFDADLDACPECGCPSSMAKTVGQENLTNYDKTKFEIKGKTLTKCLRQTKDIYIPEGVEELGEYVFQNFGKSGRIFMPESLVRIDSWAFQKCRKEIVWSDHPKIQTFDSWAFQYYEYPELRMPDSITSLSSWGLSNYKGTVIWSPNIRKVAAWAFADFSGPIDDVTIKLTEFPQYAFAKYNGTHIAISSTIHWVNPNVFKDCRYLSVDCKDELVRRFGDDVTSQM